MKSSELRPIFVSFFLASVACAADENDELGATDASTATVGSSSTSGDGSAGSSGDSAGSGGDSAGSGASAGSSGDSTSSTGGDGSTGSETSDSGPTTSGETGDGSSTGGADSGGAGASGLSGYCDRYFECGGSYYDDAQDCIDQSVAYWGDCPEMLSALDAFGDCMITIDCDDYNPDAYNPASTICAEQWGDLSDVGCNF